MPWWSSHASQPLPSTHARSGVDQSSPGACAQLTRIVAKPPSSRCAGAAPTTWRETLSPSRPLSRKRNADSGEITYGGLEVTSSKRSPPAGSKKLPARHSTFSTPLSAALKAAKLERALVDVGRDHAPAVPRGEDRLDARAGAHVERGLDRPAHGQVRERQRGPVHAGDVVRRAPRPCSRRRSEAIRISSCGTIRTSGVHLGPVRLDEAELLERSSEQRRRAPARRPRRATASSSTNSLTSGPSGSTPASRRRARGCPCSARAARRLTPSTSRRPSPSSPAARSTSPQLRDRAAVSDLQRPSLASVEPALTAANSRRPAASLLARRRRFRLARPAAAQRQGREVSNQGGGAWRRLNSVSSRRGLLGRGLLVAAGVIGLGGAVRHTSAAEAVTAVTH